VEPIVPGQVWLEVASPDGSLKQNVDVALQAGETRRQDIDFDLATGIAGRVLGLVPGDVGQVVALTGEVAVDLSSAAGVLEMDALASGTCDIDSAGRFSIEGLAPGTYTVLALVFAGESDTGDEVIHSTRIATQLATVAGAGQAVVTLTLGDG
jgi:hypothetical protein